MRTDKAVGKGAVLVTFVGYSNEMYLRKSGKEERYKVNQLLKVENGEVIIDKKVLEQYGFKVSVT